MTRTDLLKRFDEALWHTPTVARPRWQAAALRILRTLVLLVRDIAGGQLTLRAMSLVYTTLLSLVPLLALSFSVLKAFGVHNQIQPILKHFLAPLGENSGEITHRVIAFIDNMNVGVLGSMGLALLVYTAVSVIQKIEEAFNFIWHIGRARGFGERFSRYLSLLLIAPILVFAALGITATVMNADIVRRILAVEPLGQLFVGVSRLMPYLLVIAAFTFAYYFIPNTRVRPTAAALGGLMAGIAWQTAGWAFAEFVVEAGSYRAIYSGFAILILFLIWLYVSWLILLLGASIAFYFQHPEYLIASGGEPRLSNRMRERLALAVMGCLAGQFRAGRSPISADELAHRLGVPAHAVRMVAEAIERRGLIARSGDGWLPTRPLASIALAEILQVVRTAGEERYLMPDDLPLPPAAASLLHAIDAAVEEAVTGLSLDDIAVPPPEERRNPARFPRTGDTTGSRP